MDLPPFLMDWTDPQAVGDNPDGSNTPSHLLIKHRIAGPVFDASSSGPGVMRVNDIDVAGEAFDDPHLERSDYGQTEVFNVAGDPQSWCLGDNCTPASGGFAAADVRHRGRSADLVVAQGQPGDGEQAADDHARRCVPGQWHESWANWCAHRGAKPTLPLRARHQRAVHAWRDAGSRRRRQRRGRPAPRRTRWSSGRSSRQVQSPRRRSSRIETTKKAEGASKAQKAKYSR